MVNAPQVSLKVVVIAHLILTVWASMVPGFLPTAYIYMNGFILAFGVWALVAPESVESVFMFMLINLIAIVMDIIFLAIFTPIAHAAYESTSSVPSSMTHAYRFALGMGIVNLLLRPFSSFVLYRLYQDRGGQYSDFSIPGMPTFGVGARQTHGYENIDQPVPSNSVETASPHHSIDKSPLP